MTSICHLCLRSLQHPSSFMGKQGFQSFNHKWIWCPYCSASAVELVVSKLGMIAVQVTESTLIILKGMREGNIRLFPFPVNPRQLITRKVCIWTVSRSCLVSFNK